MNGCRGPRLRTVASVSVVGLLSALGAWGWTAALDGSAGRNVSHGMLAGSDEALAVAGSARTAAAKNAAQATAAPLPIRGLFPRVADFHRYASNIRDSAQARPAAAV